MRPVPVFPDYLVKLVIPASRAILKPAVIYQCVSLVTIVSSLVLKDALTGTQAGAGFVSTKKYSIQQ